ncbi:MAG: hypothetical protein DRJ15_15540, partial [Bacteroidetes bacterium]
MTNRDQSIYLYLISRFHLGRGRLRKTKHPAPTNEEIHLLLLCEVIHDSKLILSRPELVALGKKGTGLALHRYNTYKTVARLCRSNYLRKTGRSTFMPHSKAKTASYEITSKGFLILKEFHDVIA